MREVTWRYVCHQCSFPLNPGPVPMQEGIILAFQRPGLLKGLSHAWNVMAGVDGAFSLRLWAPSTRLRYDHVSGFDTIPIQLAWYFTSAYLWPTVLTFGNMAVEARNYVKLWPLRELALFIGADTSSCLADGRILDQAPLLAGQEGPLCATLQEGALPADQEAAGYTGEDLQAVPMQH